MSKKTIKISLEFEEYSSMNQLAKEEKKLLSSAKQSLKKAYAPYSNFHVGAAVLLDNSEIICGNNQENAAFPSGLCAERVAIFFANAIHPKRKIKSLAITCNSLNQEVTKPLSPCGSCRQVISETEQRQKNKIRIIMSGNSGKVLICNGIENLLPLMFKGEFLSNK